MMTENQLKHFYEHALVALLPGTKVSPSILFADEPNYIYRADNTRALRQRLARLSKNGKFRMVSEDEWERV